MDNMEAETHASNRSPSHPIPHGRQVDGKPLRAQLAKKSMAFEEELGQAAPYRRQASWHRQAQ